MKLKPDGIGGEGAARQPYGVLAFPDPLLGCAALIIEADDPFGRARQVGYDEANTRIKLARMPLDLCHHTARHLPALRLIAEVGVKAADLMRRATDRAFERMSDPFLKNLIGRQADRVLVSFGFEELVDLGVSEGGIGAEVAAGLSVPVTRDHRFQNVVLAIGGMDVAG